MKTPKELLKIAASSDITVLLQGESGSGKEVAARFLHEKGPRQQGPFIALNCGAIAKNLMESILEGAKKGAFTGAVTDQIGVVRAANGGTLFLDEIGELPLDCQCRLLRILQERSVMPIGSSQSIPVNFRLICATNRNLRNEIAENRFREDLFFRINTFPITLEPLREREDFDAIVHEIWQELCKREFCSHELQDYVHQDLSSADVAQLHLFNWPGNIRQLKNVLQRYALMKPHGITLEEILCDEYTGLETADKKHDWETIQYVLEQCGGNKVQASKRLGISRSNLYEQIKKATLKRVAV